MSQFRNDTTGQRTSTVGLTESERHRLLAAERRRVILDVLTENAALELGELTTAVATREPGVDAADEEDVEHVMISLYHVHLPMLEEYGCITMNDWTRRVEKGPNWARMTPLL
ncbi:hypothetical protein OB919_09215 [Halobacteria archaeon AArc-curdl1]|uniref:DUF7344 domain-containing protein n=1 Tax=Natronosalvus hydrolyticus TaxID=2979988 RepID=A0AAP2Z8X2_9EURY|nr:hypothetical protein [Halobacteria archaeon AArc-curdl1]